MEKPAEAVQGLPDMVVGQRSPSSTKCHTCPPHIQTMLYGQDDELANTLPYVGLFARSFISGKRLSEAFEKRRTPEPSPKKMSGMVDKVVRMRRKDKKLEKDDSDGYIHKYRRFNEVLNMSKFGKIQFSDIGSKCDVMPSWVLARLETACRSFRFELPFNKKLLEGMSPLQFLANYTRLTKEQRRRYAELYKKFKSKHYDYLENKSLNAALNSMLAGYLSDENFSVLCTCLFISPESNMDCNTFVGLCAFTDRLFWTAYLEYEDDTFSFWAPNRSALEYADFENLKRKLGDVKLSKELNALLHSLA